MKGSLRRGWDRAIEANPVPLEPMETTTGIAVRSGMQVSGGTWSDLLFYTDGIPNSAVTVCFLYFFSEVNPFHPLCEANL